MSEHLETCSFSLLIFSITNAKCYTNIWYQKAKFTEVAIKKVNINWLKIVKGKDNWSNNRNLVQLRASVEVRRQFLFHLQLILSKFSGLDIPTTEGCYPSWRTYRILDSKRTPGGVGAMFGAKMKGREYLPRNPQPLLVGRAGTSQTNANVHAGAPPKAVLMQFDWEACQLIVLSCS